MEKSPDAAVTVLISRRVKPGHEEAFERLSRQLMEVAASFAGYLGAQLVHPGEEPGVEDGLYHVVLAFENRASLDRWQDAPARSLGLTALADAHGQWQRTDFRQLGNDTVERYERC